MRALAFPRRAVSLGACALALAAIALLAPPAPAQITPVPPVSEQVQRAFEQTDLNGDGRVDREEFQRRTVEVFFFLDRDRNGFLLIQDLTEVRAEAFKAADRDRDGTLSLSEYVNARFKDFEAADANGDGGVTREELERWIQGPPAR